MIKRKHIPDLAEKLLNLETAEEAEAVLGEYMEYLRKQRIKYAKREKPWGRPPTLSPEQLEEVKKLNERGWSLRKIRDHLKLDSHMVVQRALSREKGGQERGESSDLI